MIPSSELQLQNALILRKSVEEYGNRKCLGKRSGEGPFEWLTYAEVGKKVNDMGSALAGSGLNPKQAVGVIGSNSPEWMIAMQVTSMGP